MQKRLMALVITGGTIVGSCLFAGGVASAAEALTIAPSPASVIGVSGVDTRSGKALGEEKPAVAAPPTVVEEVAPAQPVAIPTEDDAAVTDDPPADPTDDKDCDKTGWDGSGWSGDDRTGDDGWGDGDHDGGSWGDGRGDRDGR